MDSESSSDPQYSGSKSLLILSIVIVLLVLGGIGYTVLSKKSNQSVLLQTSATPTPSSPTTSQQNNNVFASIKDALTKSLSLQCDYSATESGMKTTAYIKNGAIRADVTGSNPQQSSSMIMKDKKMYFWNGATGMMMDFDPSSITPPQISGSMSPQNTQSGTSLMDSLEKFKQYCKPSLVPDSLFTPPATVKFTDASSMMKTTATQTYPSVDPTKMQQMINQYKNSPTSQ